MGMTFQIKSKTKKNFWGDPKQTVGGSATIVPILKGAELTKAKKRIKQLDALAEKFANEGDVETSDGYFDRARTLEGCIPIKHKKFVKMGDKVVAVMKHKRKDGATIICCKRGRGK